MSITTPDISVGEVRLLSDMRQIAGLLMLTGFCALMQPLFGSAAAIDGATGTTPNAGVPLAALIGGLFVALTGVLSIFAGYLQLGHDMGSTKLTIFLLLWVQTAWVPYISNMTGVGKATMSGTGFINPLYEPTEQDVHIVGSCGILGIFAYGFGLVGSVAFLQFSLYAYQVGKPEHRGRSYYKGRLTAYAFMLFVGGLSQCLLGSWILTRFGMTLQHGPIQVAFYLINIPWIPIAVGGLQVLNGLWGVLRSCGMLTYGEDDNLYQVSLGVSWFVQLLLQVVTQASWLPGPAGAGIAPTVAAFSVGLSLMPAFLDYKSRTTPDPLSEYYAAIDGKEDDVEY